jgi:hypothetical protein
MLLAVAVTAGMAGTAALAGTGCSSSANFAEGPYPYDAEAQDGTLSDGAPLRDDGGGYNSDAGTAADAGPYTGLRCSVTPCVLALAAGGSHVCALLEDHTVRCWGGNASGELGTGSVDGGVVTPAQTATPTAVQGIAGATQVAAGGYGSGFGTSCVVTADGAVWCWGSNQNGALGIGAAADAGPPPMLSVEPMRLDAPSVGQLALGGMFGCAVVGDGGIAFWGDNSQNELGRQLDAGSWDPTPTLVALPGPAASVATGKHHACALLRSGTVACWGAADHGEIGEVVDGGVATPQLVTGLVATQITAGEVSTCAITSAGGVACWGGNQGGQLGRGDSDAAAIDPTPQPVSLPTGTTALQIAGAVGSTCALLSDRTVWCWGDNAYGELGTGSAVPGFSPRPAPVQGLVNVVSIASGPGGWTTCALLQNGSARCWGVNSADQLGVDTSGDAGPDETPHPVPIRVLF